MTGAFVASIESSIASEMERLRVAGCAFALINNFEHTELYCFGVADSATREPVRTDTRFCLQSVSKSIASWAVMKLAEEGRIDLDRPVCNYLTRWKLPDSSDHDQRLVTPRLLLSHHAGITEAGFRGVGLHQKTYTLIDAMEARVSGKWYETARAAGVSERDCDRIASAFVYPGSRQVREA